MNAALAKDATPTITQRHGLHETSRGMSASNAPPMPSDFAPATTPSTPKITNATFNNQQRQEVAMEQRGVGAKGAAMINEQTINKRTTMNEE